MSSSVIIPTLNEAGNVSQLLRRLSAVLDPDDEILFVDDGQDDLPDIVAREAPTYLQKINVCRRMNSAGGLGGAVIAGIRATEGDVVVVCDGDLQHPPESIPGMVVALDNADVVVASRYCVGGSADGLASGRRRLASRSTGVLSRLLFPLKLKDCTDPMSGYFAFRRNAIDIDQLQPRGFKILLELIVRSPRMPILEEPFVFADRGAGASHATYDEGIRFLSPGAFRSIHEPS